MRVLFEAEGHVVLGLYSALTIGTDVRDFVPDVVFMDIAMPGRHGWDAALEIRAACPGKGITMVAVSGEYPKGVEPAWLKASAFDHFLIKPADPKVLLQLVRAHAEDEIAKGETG